MVYLAIIGLLRDQTILTTNNFAAMVMGDAFVSYFWLALQMLVKKDMLTDANFQFFKEYHHAERDVKYLMGCYDAGILNAKTRALLSIMREQTWFSNAFHLLELNKMVTYENLLALHQAKGSFANARYPDGKQAFPTYPHAGFYYGRPVEYDLTGHWNGR